MEEEKMELLFQSEIVVPNLSKNLFYFFLFSFSSLLINKNHHVVYAFLPLSLL
jgi:hypothetical protein